tara:strand:+ start:565 stop:837 length:273 start_codon:yes stop_codon:yes gene_type:complete
MILVIIATSITSLNFASDNNTPANNNNKNIVSVLTKPFLKDYDNERIAKHHPTLKDMLLPNATATIRNAIALLRSTLTTDTPKTNQNNQA